jgi:hypothetical protein
MLQMTGPVQIEASMRSSFALVHTLALAEAVHIMAPLCQYFRWAHSGDVLNAQRSHSYGAVVTVVILETRGI